MPVIVSYVSSILLGVANQIMYLNKGVAKCYNRRLLVPPPVGPKTNLQNNFRQAAPPKQQKVLSKLMSNEAILNGFTANQSVETLPLNHENYTAYVFTVLFDAHYLPWLKNCYSDSFREEFSSRLEHFNLSLQSAITDFRYYKRPIGEMAKKHAFTLQRQLKITVDEVTRHSDGGKHRIDGKCLRVLIRSTNSASGGGGLETTFHYPLRVPLQGSSSELLDISTEMNRHNSQLTFEFRLAEDGAESAHDPHVFSLEVKEYEISGFSGYSTKFTLWDEAVKDTVNVKLALSWQLGVQSIQEHIKHGHIVASHFSMTLLALGPYFWRFYSSLFSALLLRARDTEAECMKSFHEVAFLLDGPQLTLLLKPLMEVMRKRIQVQMGHESGAYCSCNAADCRITWHLVHGAFLLIEHLPPSEQSDLMAVLVHSAYYSAFAHLLRFRCRSVAAWKVLQLHQMGQRRLAAVIAAASVVSKEEEKEEEEAQLEQQQLQPEQTEAFLLLLAQLIVDTVKHGVQLSKAANSSVEAVTDLQSSTVRNFAKFLVHFGSSRNSTFQLNPPEDDSGFHEDGAEGIGPLERMSVSTPFETSVNFVPHRDSGNWLSANAGSAEEANQQQKAKEENCAARGMPLKEVLARLASRDHGRSTSSYPNYPLLYAVLPAKVVGLFVAEDVLSAEFYTPMMTLLGDVAQEMGIL